MNLKYKHGDFVRDKLSKKVGIVHALKIIPGTYGKLEYYEVRFENTKKLSGPMFETINMYEAEIIDV